MRPDDRKTADKHQSTRDVYNRRDLGIVEMWLHKGELRKDHGCDGWTHQPAYLF